MRKLLRILFARKACVLLSIVFLFTKVEGQVPDEKDLSPADIKRVKEELNLVADKIKIKSQTLLVDSALLNFERETEENMLPADELYDGEWNNEYVKAYKNSVIPDSFKIDVSSFIMPFKGKVTSQFGVRRRRFHFGTDIKLQIGDTVVAAFDGKVRVKKNQGRRKGYGLYLVLRHPNGLETVYGHLSDFLVNLGENVKAGQPIGLGGNTGRSFGSHLHFECRFLGMPINPEEIVDFENQCTFDENYTFVKNKSEKYNYAYAKRSLTPKKSSASKTTPKKTTATTTLNRFTEEGDGKIKYYRTKEGDTLSIIAIKNGTTVFRLCQLNGITKRTVLKTGRVIRCS
jgi:murein DD-endopeptidase MepM/ murein hydrolase activator NlpD